jgi:hypothetical protein
MDKGVLEELITERKELMTENKTMLTQIIKLIVLAPQGADIAKYMTLKLRYEKIGKLDAITVQALEDYKVLMDKQLVVNTN